METKTLEDLVADKMILPIVPLRIEFEITEKCNLGCKYCYAKNCNGEWVLTEEEKKCFTPRVPSFGDLKLLFEKTEKEVHPFEVILLGGEPFTRKDIIPLLEFASQTFSKIGTGVSTNGTHFTELSRDELNRLRNLTENNDISLQISLDSTTPAINDVFRGKGEKVMEGLKLLEENGISFSVGIVLSKNNADDISKSVRELLKFKQMKVLNLEPLQFTLALGEKINEIRLEPDKMLQILDDVHKIVDETNRTGILIHGVKPTSNMSKECVPLIETYGFKACIAGVTRAGVLVDGTVTPCLALRHVDCGNAYTEPWKDITKRLQKRYMNLKMSDEQCTELNRLVRKEEMIRQLSKV